MVSKGTPCTPAGTPHAADSLPVSPLSRHLRRKKVGGRSRGACPGSAAAAPAPSFAPDWKKNRVWVMTLAVANNAFFAIFLVVLPLCLQFHLGTTTFTVPKRQVVGSQSRTMLCTKCTTTNDSSYKRKSPAVKTGRTLLQVWMTLHTLRVFSYQHPAAFSERVRGARIALNT